LPNNSHKRHKEEVERLASIGDSLVFLQPGTEGFERKQGALEAGGFDVAFEGGDEVVVGDGTGG